MFWSTKRLAERLKRNGLIQPYCPEHVDCAAYTLAIGSEVYVSPNEQEKDPTRVTIKKLESGEPFPIPPGQFAFLLTDETVRVPTDALALISIRAKVSGSRAKVKFRGLVNVSGFHVDPGYHGQLDMLRCGQWAGYNAGPVPIHLRQGERIFLIWYADLDADADGKNELTAPGLDMEVIAGIAGQVPSYAGLAKRIEDVSERVHGVEKRQQAIQALLALVAGGVITWLFRLWA